MLEAMRSYCGRHLGKLAAVLAEQLLQDDFGLLDARGIELALDGQTYLALFEAVEDVGFGNGVNAVIADAANDRALFDVEDDVLVIGSVGRVFDAEFDVFEKLRVPESLKVAAQSFFVIRIALAAEDARL